MPTNPTQGVKITKREGVRRALAELGKEATRAQIQAFVKDRFGIEITLDHISATKGELQKMSDKTKPAAAKKKDTASETISKSEAVRRALSQLGLDATRVQIHDLVKDQFGIEMNLDHISTAKGEAIRKLKAKSTPAKASTAIKAASAPTARPQPAPIQAKASQVVASPRAAIPPIPMEDILTLKALVERIGAEQVRTLMAVMGK